MFRVGPREWGWYAGKERERRKEIPVKVELRQIEFKSLALAFVTLDNIFHFLP